MPSAAFLQRLGLDPPLDDNKPVVDHNSIPLGGIAHPPPPPPRPAPDPAVLAQFRAAVENERYGCAQWDALKQRIDKGVALVREHVTEPQCRAWLDELLAKDAYDAAGRVTQQCLVDRLKHQRATIMGQPAHGAVELLQQLRREQIKAGQQIEWYALQAQELEQQLVRDAGLTGKATCCRFCLGFVSNGDYVTHQEQCWAWCPATEEG